MELIAGNFATKSLVFVDITDTVQHAAEIMKDNDVSSVIILEKNVAKGIVTERDMTHKVVAMGLDPTKIPVNKIMSSPLITADKNLGIVDAARMMRDNNIKKLVIVDGRKVVGILSERDVLEIDPALHSKVLGDFKNK